MKSYMLPAPAKRVASIAIPAIGEAYLQCLLGVVDAWFIARIRIVAVNAVGVTNIYSLTYIGVFTAVSTALSVFLSRAVGGKNFERGRSVVWHGYVVALALGFILSAVSIFLTSPLLHIMGAYGELEEAALPYFQVVLGISPLIALFTAQSAAFRATGDTKTPLKVALDERASRRTGLCADLRFRDDPRVGIGRSCLGYGNRTAVCAASLMVEVQKGGCDPFAQRRLHLASTNEIDNNVLKCQIKF
ncbi:MATE family efflux transporter [Paenibacillus aestuarii]|uniref:Probable multidrug resistance protein NorM n=1 Tax=Paenibacillus aestuarii TaxID=516965 RepID=A0ABW0KG68_9BACL|nr:MATE family efflux transporter [Paenibacillus aestuarii]